MTTQQGTIYVYLILRLCLLIAIIQCVAVIMNNRSKIINSEFFSDKMELLWIEMEARKTYLLGLQAMRLCS